MPKSMILTRPSARSMMFWGLMSRWTTPFWWAWSSASSTCWQKWTTSFQVRGPPRRFMYSFRVMPSMYSITMNWSRSVTETS